MMIDKRYILGKFLGGVSFALGYDSAELVIKAIKKHKKKKEKMDFNESPKDFEEPNHKNDDSEKENSHEELSEWSNIAKSYGGDDPEEHKVITPYKIDEETANSLTGYSTLELLYFVGGKTDTLTDEDLKPVDDVYYSVGVISQGDFDESGELWIENDNINVVYHICLSMMDYDEIMSSSGQETPD